jgi:magnesium transporter
MKIFSDIEGLEQQIRTALDEDDTGGVRSLLVEQHPADVADVLDRLEGEAQARLFRLLPPEQAADVLSETSAGTTRELVQQLEQAEVRDLFSNISLDDVVEILSEDVPDQQQTILTALEPAEAQEVRTLLTYPPRSAGRLMTEEFVRVRPQMSVADALAFLREVGQRVETITDLFVLDEQGCLQGVVTLRDLVTTPPAQPLALIVREQVISVTPETDQEEVAWRVSQYDLLAIPVVTAEQQMLGIITVDDVIDVLVQESTEDVLRLGAIQEGATDETYFSVPIWRAIRRRIGWLLLLFLTGMITVNVLSYFETILAEVVALSFFIPLLIGTGGNTGAQTVSTIVRSLALGDVRLRDIWRVIWREAEGGLLLGGLLSLVALGMGVVLSGSWSIALVVALSVVAICTWANIIGAVVPMIAERFGLDPALVSAPLITTLVDATGLAIYLGIAKVVLGV